MKKIFKRFFISTRIVYERDFLMNLRNSPISQTPPRNMPSIPGELLKNTLQNFSTSAKNQINKGCFCSVIDLHTPVIEESAEQFEMDM
ncbi:hypothetical protein E2986_01547 [Frieseomelitta varia]|uniref:Uncharacterized protein n=1 Tax=Frieseomelitta varia TaxID=561572 RepID=A0A833RRH9_9HYME|nr:hypothetical protein E2986_01547 [Frieseomelitta varia]